MCPDKQRKMQEELDRVIGATSLPTIQDKADLPYVGAVIKEVFRWHPTLPIGMPHMNSFLDAVLILNHHL